MNNIKTKKITLILGITFLAFIIIFMITYLNFKNRITDLEELTIKSMESGSINKVILENNIERSENNLNKLNNYFVEKENIVSFISLIESVARASQTDFRVVTIDEGEEGDNLSMVVEAKGSWTNVSNFLIGVENLPKIININDTKIISTTNTETGETVWTLSVGLESIVKMDNKDE